MRSVIKVNRSDFVAAVEACASIVPTNTPMELLKSIVIRSEDGILTVQSTDNEIGVRVTLADAGNCACEAALPAQRLRQIVSSGSEDVVEIDVGERSATIKCGGTFRLQSSQMDGWVDVLGFDSIDFWSTDLSKFRAAMGLAVKCVDPTNTKYAIGGVLVDIAGGEVVATDTRRIILASVPWRATGEPYAPSTPTDPQVLIPAKASAVLSKLDGANVDIIVSGSNAIFRCGTTVVSVRLCVGRFPSTRQFKSVPTTTVSEFLAGQMLSAVQRLQIVTSEESAGATFDFVHERIVAKSGSASIGDAECVVTATHAGPPVKFRTNPRFLADMLSRVDKTAVVKVSATDGDHVAMFDVDAAGWRYGVMPMVIEEVSVAAAAGRPAAAGGGLVSRSWK